MPLKAAGGDRQIISSEPGCILAGESTAPQFFAAVTDRQASGCRRMTAAGDCVRTAIGEQPGNGSSNLELSIFGELST